ncbi:hypothetical protein O181_084805 [Austropuccinia psidii MF-1]|uniref:Uncharacterized protein n=1 Tax=Austropuccinia psidii MF-1 TaxID=1389203 RepID=A0A9Q3FWB7_9BASI|nr:hypothetical protein [Austropuccinia psidii MF-1]
MAPGHILPSLAPLANSPPHQPPSHYPCFWAWGVFSVSEGPMAPLATTRALGPTIYISRVWAKGQLDPFWPNSNEAKRGHQGKSCINHWGLTSHCTPGSIKSCFSCVSVLYMPYQNFSDTTYHPYARGVPSQHDSNTAYHPYARGVPSRHDSNTTYHPYAHRVPSRHGSDAALTPAQSSKPLMILTLLPGPQYDTKMPPCAACNPYAPAATSRYASETALSPPYASAPLPLTILRFPYYIHSVQWLVGVHNERNQGNMLSGLLCQQDLRGNWSVYSQCCG